MLPDILMCNDRSLDYKCDIAWSTDEVRRVLSMDIPVAVIIEMPRIHGLGFTDIIMGFQSKGIIDIWNYTIQQRAVKPTYIFSYVNQFYKDNREFEDDPPNPPKEVKTYRYAVKLAPFLIGHSCDIKKDSFKGLFIIPYSSIGYDGIEIEMGYEQEERDHEYLELKHFMSSNNSDYSNPNRFKRIDRFTPRRIPNTTSTVNNALSPRNLPYELIWQAENKPLPYKELPNIHNFFDD